MSIAEPEGKIIVHSTYDSSVKANLAKTKLDAYGIPCFLLDENFVNLLPIQNMYLPGVRLCILAQDRERADDILKEESSDHFQNPNP